MKIQIEQSGNYSYRYYIRDDNYTQEQFDYMFKYLDFEKISKNWYICFKNHKTSEWFKKTYIEENCLKDIYNDSLEGYEWLKNNWGKGIFELYIWYKNKQELKTIVNRVINVELKKRC